MKVIIVGFRVTEDNSVFYKKLDVILGESKDDAKLLGAFKSALKVSDFISVRAVKEASK